MSAPIEIILHAIAGHAIGTGHFGRCAAVAQALVDLPDVAVTLVTTQEGEGLTSAYFSEAVRVITVSEGPDFATRALKTLTQDGKKPSAVFLDRYGAAAEWENATRVLGIPLMVLDDLVEACDAEVILHTIPNPTASKGSEARVMNGPAWLPLSRHIRALQDKAREDRKTRRVNICFGGSDPTHETPAAVMALNALTDMSLDVVIGPGSDFADDAFKSAEAMSRLTLHKAPDQARLAELLSKAELAVGAGGVMLWERLALGVPSLVITVAENQKPQTEWLAEKGVICLLGHTGTVKPNDIYNAVCDLLRDTAGRKAMAEMGRKLVDGRGAIRIAACLRSLTLIPRAACMEDARSLYEWRTDAANWKYNRSPAARPRLEDHIQWLQRRLGDNDCLFWVVEDRGVPKGVVRFDVQNDAAVLSIYLVPEAHGQRLGLPVYMAAEAALVVARPDVLYVKSAIHSANGGSRRLHEDAEFEINAADKPHWFEAVKRL